MHTAATIASQQLGDIDQALELLRRASSSSIPTIDKALDEAIELHRGKGEHDEVERLLKTQLDQAKDGADRDEDRRASSTSSASSTRSS